MISYLSLRERLFNYQDPLILITIMVTSVVKFSRKGYKIRYSFGQNPDTQRKLMYFVNGTMMSKSDSQY